MSDKELINADMKRCEECARELKLKSWHDCAESYETNATCFRSRRLCAAFIRQLERDLKGFAVSFNLGKKTGTAYGRDMPLAEASELNKATLAELYIHADRVEIDAHKEVGV